MSVQQCLLACQDEGRGAPGVPPPYLALWEPLPQLLVLALAGPGGPRGAGRPPVLSTLKFIGKEGRVLRAREGGVSPAPGRSKRDTGW